MPTIAEPLHLVPHLVDKPWGGRALSRYGRDLPEGATVGESWEVADLPLAPGIVQGGVTRVAGGTFAGCTLGELMLKDPVGLLGDAASATAEDGAGQACFPLLVKLLDVHERLSVQVHPHRSVDRNLGGVRAKTETWVVLDADPDAQLLIGFEPGVTLTEIRNVAGTPAVAQLMRRIPARVGDIHHLPAGTPHCVIGPVLLAEIQTPSDTTFRLYDWAAETGKPSRELHVDEAVTTLASVTPQILSRQAGRVTLPFDAGVYRLDRHSLDVEATSGIAPGRLRVVLVTAGELSGDGFLWPVGAGATVVLPAAWSGRLRADRPTSWLETTLPPRA